MFGVTSVYITPLGRIETIVIDGANLLRGTIHVRCIFVNVDPYCNIIRLAHNLVKIDVWV